MKRILIITYYWPPSGGSAVLRWLKFVKYLREYGWEPVVYTPSNPEPQEIDASLVREIPDNIEVITSPIWEPYSIYKKLTGRKKEDRLGVALMAEKAKPGRMAIISLWIRSNLFIPDPRRCWVSPSVKYLSGYLRERPVSVILTTGPPHSMHLIGMRLKKRLGINWVADFRDPWTSIDFYNDLLLTPWADRCHRKLEKQVLATADEVVTVSPGMTREFRSMGISRVTTITNGYDAEPLQPVTSNPAKFTLLHLGSMPRTRNPENLWKVLAELVKSHPAFSGLLQVHLIGKTDIAVKQSILENNLQEYVIAEDFVPHDQTLGRLTGAGILLLCINNTPNADSILTNKFYEYLSAHRPILAFGPTDGDASAILSETGAGRIFHYSDIEGLKNHLLNLFALYLQQNLTVQSRDIERFTRRNLTGELCTLLNRITS